MRLAPDLIWTCGDPPQPVDARLVPLLQAIVARGSLAAAVPHIGVSYRAAWGLLRRYEAVLGTPLVDLERGRGATLTPAGRRLVEAQRTASERFARLQHDLAFEIGAAPVSRPHTPALLRLRVAASHDLALAAMRDDVSRQGVDLDVAFMGSVHALEAFRAGDVDLAGFHLPLRRELRGDAASLRGLVHARRDRLITFVEREQGLMLVRSQARHVRSLRDVAQRDLVFVNRQRGSGTRLAVDALLKRDGIAPSAIRGYSTEEFTHRAVAATIASGGAQAGFGLRAAAEEYDLAFVPLLRETYYLAVRASAVQQPALQRLLRYLGSGTFGAIVHRLPGYRAPDAGKLVDVEVID